MQKRKNTNLKIFKKEEKRQPVNWARQIILIFRDAENLSLDAYLKAIRQKLGENYNHTRALAHLTKAVKRGDIITLNHKVTGEVGYFINPNLKRKKRGNKTKYESLADYIKGEGRTAEEFAKAAGVDASTVYMHMGLERRFKHPTLENAIAMWKAAKKRFPIESFLLDGSKKDSYSEQNNDEDGDKDSLDIL